MHWMAACVECRSPIDVDLAGPPPNTSRSDPTAAPHPSSSSCPVCGWTLRSVDGIWRAISRRDRPQVEADLATYTAVRHAERPHPDPPEWYRSLPHMSTSDPQADLWRMRAVSYRALVRTIAQAQPHTPPHTPPPDSKIDRRHDHHIHGHTNSHADNPINSRPDMSLRVIDVGSGHGWLSHRLHEPVLGHDVVSVDISDDARDGLGAARHLPATWPLVQAHFDRLPLAPRQADVVVFNASLHYSANLHDTLAEARRLLVDGGRIIIVDSPWYRRQSDGEKMVVERDARIRSSTGVAVTTDVGRGYLTTNRVGEEAARLGLTMSTVRVWYGWRWHTRPLRARLGRRRSPARFAVVVLTSDSRYDTATNRR